MPFAATSSGALCSVITLGPDGSNTLGVLEFWISIVVVEYGVGLPVLIRMRTLLSQVFVVRRPGILVVMGDGIEKLQNWFLLYLDPNSSDACIFIHEQVYMYALVHMHTNIVTHTWIFHAPIDGRTM